MVLILGLVFRSQFNNEATHFEALWRVTVDMLRQDGQDLIVIFLQVAVRDNLDKFGWFTLSGVMNIGGGERVPLTTARKPAFL